MTHGEKARQLFLEGYNCTQAVVGAFSDEFDVDFETLMKIASGFGGGMSRLREVCGAVSGMFIVENLRNGFSDPHAENAAQEKAAHYQRIQNLAAEFTEKNGSIICRKLLGLEEKKDNPDLEKMYSPVPEERTADFYKKRPCADLIAYAASLMEK